MITVLLRCIDSRGIVVNNNNNNKKKNEDLCDSEDCELYVIINVSLNCIVLTMIHWRIEGGGQGGLGPPPPPKIG